MHQCNNLQARYICLEGGDGSGKSTVAKAIIEKLAGRGIYINFPSSGVIGSLIRSALTGKVKLDQKAFMYLFAADGINEQGWIEEQICKNELHVICDRHPTISGRVFQLQHHEAELIDLVYNAATIDGIGTPDYLFIVDVPSDVALERMTSRAKERDVVFERMDLDYIELIRRQYLEVGRRYGATVLDGTKTVDELSDEVIEKSGLSQ